jgi:signal transduction histidine kinase
MDRSGELSVADEGSGIPPEDRERVFEPFERLTPSPRRGQLPRRRGADGSGLGLAIARTLTERMGGSIRLGDAPGGGAVFTVSLPRP